MTDLLRVMEREMLCSEHAAQCFLAAGRRQRAAKKLGEEAKKALLLSPKEITPDLDAAVTENEPPKNGGGNAVPTATPD